MKRRVIQIMLTILFVAGFVMQVFAQSTANFSSNIVQGCAPLVVSFLDSSAGNPGFWKWELGNGTVSFNRNPSTTYFNPGEYTVKLVIRTANGQSDSITKTKYITVYAPPIVNFKSSDTTGCFPLNIQFTDLSTPGSGNITNWEWDFGDGSTAAQPNPSHVYSTIGNYNVSLRVKNSNGCFTTLSKQKFIQLTNGVNANFDFTAPNNCRPPTNINFFDKSTGTGNINYRWAFGDGSTSTGTNPSHSYTTAGSYSVKLVVQNSFGCKDSLEKINAINIGTVMADFINPTRLCAGVSFQVSNISSPAPTGAFWNFGDGGTSTLVNPSKKYTSSGDYTIKLVSDFGACKDSISRTVKVLSGPLVAFTSTNNQNCKPPLNVSFVNESAGGESYKWLFGDGTSSTDKNPTHIYQQTGEYDVTLIVTGTNGCSDSIRKNSFVKIIPAKVSLLNLPFRGCAPLSYTPSIQISSIEPLIRYHWNFGDGQTSQVPNPTHVYTAPGVYTIKLLYTTRSGCTDSVTYKDAVSAGVKPTVNFTATPRDACAFQPIQFTDLSTGKPVTDWLWKFDDVAFSTLQNPPYVYGDTGYFTVSLKVSSYGCEDSLTIRDFIHIRPPIARFSDSSGCGNPFYRTFKNLSIGANSWLWDFGDGTTSDQQNPEHTFSKPGNYIVSLTVKNDTCENTARRQVQIITEKADFIASDTVICKGINVFFQTRNVNATNISEQTWLFGDGFNSGGPNNVSHRYSTSGKFNVQLIIRDINGCTDSLTKPLYIRVTGPTAEFNSNQPANCINTNITFNDLSSSDGVNPIKAWNWKYGDGSSDSLTGPPFEHRYSASGIYNVQLKVTDSKGCADSIVKPGVISILKPTANFVSPDSLSCSNAKIRFVNQSSGSALTYTWDFGDGAGRSDLFQPSYSYPGEGYYDINLKVKDRYGCLDSVTKPRYIKILNPISDFSVNDSVATCPPLVTSFTSQSQNFIAYVWNFGDGTQSNIESPTHFYNSPGTYNASLVVTSAGGCKDSTTKKMVVRGPQGDFFYKKITGCSPVAVAFNAITKDKVSFVWDFNDGNTVATSDSGISHTYTIRGRYVPKMILVDPQGCKVPIVGRDTIHVLGVDAEFLADKQKLCDSGLVIFQDSSLSNDIVTGYSWSFGDGTTSSEQDPVHFYKNAGNYPVKLAVSTKFGCRDTADKKSGINVIQSPVIGIRGDAEGCESATIELAGEVLKTDTSALIWRWDFDNGQKADVQNPSPVRYSAAGSYTVSSVAINRLGCSDTITKKIMIHPIPPVDAGSDFVICQGATYQLQGKAENYLWSPASMLSCSNCSDPFIRPDSSTKYVLSTTNKFGCKAEDSVIISVKQPFNINASLADTLCLGNSLTLFAGGAEFYNWAPAEGLDNPASSRPKASPGVSTVYRVIGRDSKNCFFDTAYTPIIVYPYPTVEVGEDKTILSGNSATLNPKMSNDVNNIRWQPVTGLSCVNCAEQIATPKRTTTYKILVSNQGGCTATDEITVFVVCKEGNLFVPNMFSPNGDGNNDVFYPRGKGIFSVKSFKIFNRWGELIYQRYNFQANEGNNNIGWDGKHLGVDSGQDVYVYLIEVICENNTVLQFNGNVTLIR